MFTDLEILNAKAGDKPYKITHDKEKKREHSLYV
jgi:hypothetical protein